MIYNIYCDESCHLENDGKKSMVIGGMSCPIDKVKMISFKIKEIKKSYSIPTHVEIKWNKISKSKDSFYFDLVDLFFNEESLKFRAIKILDKSKLSHMYFKQTHNVWYYKMYYDMLKHIIKNNSNYNIYLDIKDTKSGKQTKELKSYLNKIVKNNNVEKIQQVRSYESEILQLSDLLIGAIGYEDRMDFDNINQTKLEICKKIKGKFNLDFNKTTPFNSEKFSLLAWSGDDK